MKRVINSEKFIMMNGSISNRGAGEENLSWETSMQASIVSATVLWI